MLIKWRLRLVLRRSVISLFSDNNSNLLRGSHDFSLFSTRIPKQSLDASKVTKFLTKEHDFSLDAAARIASVTHLKSDERADSILSFLKEMGFSNVQLEKILKKSPCLLSSQLDANIKPKFEILEHLGFTSDEIVGIVSRQPRVLSYSASRIMSSASVLISVLGSTAAAAKFLRSSGRFLCDMEATFVPNVEYLKSRGVRMEQIIQLASTPQMFVRRPENFRRCVERADEMGSDSRSKVYLYAVRAVSSMNAETWERKLETLRGLGFTEFDIMRALKCPQRVLTSSTEKMKRVAEILLATGKYDAASIARNAFVFGYSIDKRITPRLQVFRALEDKNLITNWPGLHIFLPSNADFFDKFVAPYLDHVGHLWTMEGRLKKC